MGWDMAQRKALRIRNSTLKKGKTLASTWAPETSFTPAVPNVNNPYSRKSA
jgi:hypothetical protein